MTVQVCMETTEIEKVYNGISDILYQEGRGQVNAIVIGYFNSILGDGSKNKVLGPFVLCRKIETQDAHLLFQAT